MGITWQAHGKGRRGRGREERERDRGKIERVGENVGERVWAREGEGERERAAVAAAPHYCRTCIAA